MRHTMMRPHDGTRVDAGGIRHLDRTVVAGYRWGIPLESDSNRTCADTQFPADQVEGADWYIRAMRAHANCVENLPVFGAIVLGLYVGNVASAFVNALAVAVLVARIMQSLVHVCFVQTNTVASVRFGFFFVQIVSFLWLTGILLTSGSA
jgi:uncharacterized MAPEG superfamily protein